MEALIEEIGNLKFGFCLLMCSSSDGRKTGFSDRCRISGEVPQKSPFGQVHALDGMDR